MHANLYSHKSCGWYAFVFIVSYILLFNFFFLHTIWYNTQTVSFGGPGLVGPAPPSVRWTCLMLDLQYTLSLYLKHCYSHLKSIKLCANMSVKNMFTSNLLIDPGDTLKMWFKCSLSAVIVECLPEWLRRFNRYCYFIWTLFEVWTPWISPMLLRCGFAACGSFHLQFCLKALKNMLFWVEIRWSPWTRNNIPFLYMEKPLPLSIPKKSSTVLFITEPNLWWTLST